jgi:hypothetical protein
MSHETPALILPPSGPVEELFPPPAAIQPAADALTTPSPEQIRAVEAVFAQQQKESATVANLLGLYTSGVLLHNLAVDSLKSEEETKKMHRLKEKQAEGE